MASRSRAVSPDTNALAGVEVTHSEPAHDTPNGDAPTLPELRPPNEQELSALGDWCSYTRIMFNRLNMADSPYAEFMADMLSIFEPLVEAGKAGH